MQILKSEITTGMLKCSMYSVCISGYPLSGFIR